MSFSSNFPPNQALFAEALGHLDDIHDICAANGTKLAFLTVFGANLYGTATAESDLDLRGIHIPATLQARHQNIHLSTNPTENRNTSRDTDIDLISLHYWLRDLGEGNIAALDLLFSPSNKNCILYNDATLQPIFDNPLAYLNLKTDACQRYAIRQAKKYGCKGSRAGTLYAILRWLNRASPLSPAPLKTYGAVIAAHCDTPGLCRLERRNNEEFLFVCGKWHQTSIGMDIFAERIRKEVAPFLPAIENALQNQGVDHKALSHAVRAHLQTQEILARGTLTFPLLSAEHLRTIKNGDFSWVELAPLLERLDTETKALQKHSPYADKYAPAMGQAFLSAIMAP